MATRLQWAGHSTLRLESDGITLLVDPFYTGNPSAEAAGLSASDLDPTYILVSHGHEDHLGDTVALALRCNATVIANYEISKWLQEQGLTRVHGMQHGGGIALEGGLHVKLTLAFHGSTLPGGGYGGNPCGFVITLPDGRRIYDAADTALFGDMRLIGDKGLELAILPIGDYFTMGPDDAIDAIGLLRPKLVMPIHYNTFPPIAQDVEAWAKRVEAETSAKPVVPAPGEWIELG
ncbi:MAG: metal-dependent hydrolase [Isosphaeraceae bacterium]|nr:metal-dependent hydrolase [Isosphaeraceae bacterium]